MVLSLHELPFRLNGLFAVSICSYFLTFLCFFLVSHDFLCFRCHLRLLGYLQLFHLLIIRKNVLLTRNRRSLLEVPTNVSDERHYVGGELAASGC